MKQARSKRNPNVIELDESELDPFNGKSLKDLIKKSTESGPSSSPSKVASSKPPAASSSADAATKPSAPASSSSLVTDTVVSPTGTSKPPPPQRPLPPTVSLPLPAPIRPSTNASQPVCSVAKHADYDMLAASSDLLAKHCKDLTAKLAELEQQHKSDVERLTVGSEQLLFDQS